VAGYAISNALAIPDFLFADKIFGREMDVLDALLRDCAAGRAHVAVIGGPVASGKTTLLRAFAQRAAGTGAIVLDAFASRAERGLPLGILAQLLRGGQLPAVAAAQVAGVLERHAGTVSPAEPQPQSQPQSQPQGVSPGLARVFGELLEVLAELSLGRPLVLAVDDMQFADIASLQCLSYLARRAGTAPILIAATECPGTLPADRQLRAEILRQGNCRSITLAPLSADGVASLLAEHVGAETAAHLAPACHVLTGGNLLLVNAVREDSGISADPSPLTAPQLTPAAPQATLVPGPAFRSAVVTCLHRYDPATVELGRAVAILNGAGTLSLLADMLAVSPESVAQETEALIASGLLESAARFRHEQARQAVLRQMTADERAAMHATAAMAQYRTGAPPSTLARHLVAARQVGTRWAVTALHEAGEQALADGEINRAIDYLRLAKRECADDRQFDDRQFDDRQCAAVTFSLARAEWVIDPERAARHLPGLVGAARAGLLSKDCLGELADYLLWAGETGSVAEILALMDGAANAVPRPRATTQHSGAQHSGAQYSGAQQPGLWSPRELLYPNLVAQARQVNRDRDAKAGPPHLEDAAGAAVVRAERILAERGRSDPTLAAITAALLTLICEDLLDRAESWCGVLIRECDALEGNQLWRAVLTSLSAMIETRRGNLAAAQTQASTALNALTRRAWGVAVGSPLSSLLLAATATHQHEDAAKCLRTPIPAAMFDTIYGLLYLAARGEYFLATGRPQAALADFTDCGNRMSNWGLDLPGLVPWRVKAAEAQLALGENSQARELSRAQLEQAKTRFPRTRGISLRMLAVTSHPTKRVAMLRESAEILQDSGARLELARTFTELSNAHLALGEHSRAQWAARQARSLAERCGAQLAQTALDTAAAGQPDAGQRDAARTGAGQQEPGCEADTGLLTQLSQAEQRVARLAAYGYTNGQIASKLYITVSTVEQHLTHTYRKLGVAGRAELPIEVQ
jgi:DNA-binding CsgD family transcriptional regulator